MKEGTPRTARVTGARRENVWIVIHSSYPQSMDSVCAADQEEFVLEVGRWFCAYAPWVDAVTTVFPDSEDVEIDLSAPSLRATYDAAGSKKKTGVPFDWSVAISSALRHKPTQERRLAALARLIISPDGDAGWPLLGPIFYEELTTEERDVVLHWYDVWDAEMSPKKL